MLTIKDKEWFGSNVNWFKLLAYKIHYHIIPTTRKWKGIFSKGTNNSKQIPTVSFLPSTQNCRKTKNLTVSKLNDSGKKNIHNANFLSEPESRVNYAGWFVFFS